MADMPASVIAAAEEAIIRAASDFSGDAEERSSRKLARAALEAAAPLLAQAVTVTDEMVERACHALWWNPEVPSSQPYSAHARDFVGMLDEYSDEEKAPGGQRDRDLERFRAAEHDAEQMSRALMRRTLEAALADPGAAPVTPEGEET